ncbi:MAG: hypothetical protein GY811_19765 [Myxococcales bacterium]|nr:hypothetical protein [Myxococcales bacterium]
MARLSIPLVALVVGLCVSISGCGKNKEADNAGEDESSDLTCESNSDCEPGWVCLEEECANAASGAIYTDTTNAVTPDKVRGQIEKIQEDSNKRADEVLKGL